MKIKCSKCRKWIEMNDRENPFDICPECMETLSDEEAEG